MKVLILAAGYGTRLYPIIKDTPKALLEINGRPLTNYILDRFNGIADVNEVIIVTNNKFYQHFLQWRDGQKGLPYRITVVNDLTQTPEDRLGSIGDIDFAIRAARLDEDIVVVGGDNLFDFNIREYLAFAGQQREAVTIGLYDIGSLKDAVKFGVVGTDKNNKIISFQEKPAEPKSTLIAMCFYYFPKATLGFVADYLAQVKKSDTAGDYIRWLREKKEVYGFKFSGQWYDIGSVEAFYEAQKAFDGNKL
ncbi:MAG: nucleotidyltransferase family protein [Candidatus Omnitrophica bacterium]|nr:nucleotidyltransferase family protein [Candidatus Omnitrophota bacterium]